MGGQKIPLYKIYNDEEDVESVARVIRRGSYWSAGPEVERLEAYIAHEWDRKFAVTFNSGSTALQALLLSYDFETGSEIIAPSFTFSSSISSILLSGYRPSFVDIEKKFRGVDPLEIGEIVGPKTKAVMPTHVGGCPCDIEAIRRAANDHGLILIEDAAESIGAEIRGVGKVGSFGDAAIFSFSGNKVITSGEGGVVVTDSEKIAERVRAIGSHGAETRDAFKSPLAREYVKLGSNWRMSDITASIAYSQIQKLPRLIKLRNEKARYLTDRLSKTPGIKTPEFDDDRLRTFQMYTIEVEDGRRDDLKRYLEENGVTSKVYFEPLHHKYDTEKRLPITESTSIRVLTLPMYASITNEELDYIAHTVNAFLETKQYSGRGKK